MPGGILGKQWCAYMGSIKCRPVQLPAYIRHNWSDQFSSSAVKKESTKRTDPLFKKVKTGYKWYELLLNKRESEAILIAQRISTTMYLYGAPTAGEDFTPLTEVPQAMHALTLHLIMQATHILWWHGTSSIAASQDRQMMQESLLGFGA